MVQGRITEVDTTTVQLGATPSELFRPYPTIFTPDALPATTLPIYPGLGQAQEYAGLHTAVAWFPVAWSPRGLAYCNYNSESLSASERI